MKAHDASPEDEDNSREAGPQQQDHPGHLRQNPHEVGLAHRRIPQPDGIGHRPEGHGGSHHECAVDHPGAKDDVRQMPVPPSAAAQDASQARNEPKKRECSHHPDVRADDVARVIVAIAKVIGDLLPGRVSVRNVGHEEGANEHQNDKDDAGERGPTFQLPDRVLAYRRPEPPLALSSASWRTSAPPQIAVAHQNRPSGGTSRPWESLRPRVQPKAPRLRTREAASDLSSSRDGNDLVS